jgi:3',5'-cyclic-nucleotide phosphodiesterase
MEFYSISNTIISNSQASMSNNILVNKHIIIPDDLFTWKFNVLDIDGKFVLKSIIGKIFQTFIEENNYKKINEIGLKVFIKTVSDLYHDRPYHNFHHATNVLHITYMILRDCKLLAVLDSDIVFSILLAALTHDIDHPGNNNIYEIMTGSPLALKYNDLSVLEQHHCHLTFELIEKHRLFENYNRQEFMKCRKTIISCILATDMSNHKSILDILTNKKHNLDNLDDQILIGKIIVHAADIGNPIQEPLLCEKWARMVSQEFHNQILSEEERGIKPFTSFNYNSTESFYTHEIKYINYICLPYWSELVRVFPQLSDQLQNILANLKIYTDKLNKLKSFIAEEINITEF